MKQFLFRGVDRKTKEWAFGSLFRIESSPFGIDIIIKECSRMASGKKIGEDSLAFDPDSFSVCIPGTVGQFTGARDKSGNRIFEGDIVRMTYKKATDYIDDEQVYYESGDFIGVAVLTSRGIQLNPVYVITDRERKNGCHYSQTSYKTITARRSQVIGNVFSNPDWEKKLLK